MKMSDRLFVVALVMVAVVAIIAAQQLEQMDRGANYIDSHYIRWANHNSTRPAVKDQFSTAANADTVTRIVGTAKDCTAVFKHSSLNSIQIIQDDTTSSDSSSYELKYYTSSYPAHRRHKVMPWASGWVLVDSITVTGSTLAKDKGRVWNISDSPNPVHHNAFIQAEGLAGNKKTTYSKLILLKSSRDFK